MKRHLIRYNENGKRAKFPTEDQTMKMTLRRSLRKRGGEKRSYKVRVEYFESGGREGGRDGGEGQE